MIDTKQLRQKILDLAIRGKLVPQDPNEEPASVLLERIKTEKERLIAEGKIKRSKKTAKPADTLHYENVPFEIPESWEWVAIQDIFEMNPKTDAEDNDVAGFIPMELVEGGVGTCHSFAERKWGEIKKGYSHFKKGDIGIAKISPCFENRKSVIFNNLPNGIGAGTTELTILRGMIVNIEYFLYVFQSEWYIKEGTKYFKGVVGQQRVNKAIFTSLHVPVPPIKEQHRIIKEIEKWLEIIDVVENKKEDLRTYIQQTKSKILSLAISGKLVTQNPNDEPAIELLRRINPSFVFCDTSHYGNFPDTWCGAKLNDLGVSILNGFAFQSKKYTPFGVKVIRITNVQDGYISDSDPKFYPDSEEISRYKLKENDLLMSLTGNVGRVGFLPKSMLPAALNQRVACLRTTENIVLKKYLFYFLLSETFKEDCIISGKGVAQLNVSTEWLKQYIMPLPPISEQSRIVKRVEEVFGVLDVISTEL